MGVSRVWMIQGRGPRGEGLPLNRWAVFGYTSRRKAGPPSRWVTWFPSVLHRPESLSLLKSFSKYTDYC